MATTATPPILALPLELRQEIYRYAYCKSSVIGIVKAEGKGVLRNPKRRCVLEKFRVCHEWYDEVAEWWTRRSTVEFDAVTPSLILRKRPELGEWLVKLSIRWFTEDFRFEGLVECTNLAHLGVKVYQAVFTGDDVFPDKQCIDEDVIRAMRSVGSFPYLPIEVKIHVIPVFTYDMDGHERAIWTENVAKLGNVLRKKQTWSRRPMGEVSAAERLQIEERARDQSDRESRWEMQRQKEAGRREIPPGPKVQSRSTGYWATVLQDEPAGQPARASPQAAVIPQATATPHASTTPQGQPFDIRAFLANFQRYRNLHNPVVTPFADRWGNSSYVKKIFARELDPEPQELALPIDEPPAGRRSVFGAGLVAHEPVSTHYKKRKRRFGPAAQNVDANRRKELASSQVLPQANVAGLPANERVTVSNHKMGRDRRLGSAEQDVQEKEPQGSAAPESTSEGLAEEAIVGLYAKGQTPSSGPRKKGRGHKRRSARLGKPRGPKFARLKEAEA